MKRAHELDNGKMTDHVINRVPNIYTSLFQAVFHLKVFAEYLELMLTLSRYFYPYTHFFV